MPRARLPVIHRDGLPCLVPGELASGNGRCRRADVSPECEQPIEGPEKVDVPRLGFRNRELSECRVRIDEHFARNPGVLVAPEPRSARQIDEEIGASRVAFHLVGASTVIGAVVIHEAPAITETVRLERIVDVGRAVRRIRRACVEHRIVHTLARIFDVEHLVAERAQPQEIHQRTPGDAAERIAGDDACEQDSHGMGRMGRLGGMGRTRDPALPFPPPQFIAWPLR